VLFGAKEISIRVLGIDMLIFIVEFKAIERKKKYMKGRLIVLLIHRKRKCK
jgi:hypothetical protein